LGERRGVGHDVRPLVDHIRFAAAVQFCRPPGTVVIIELAASKWAAPTYPGSRCRDGMAILGGVPAGLVFVEARYGLPHVCWWGPRSRMNSGNRPGSTVLGRGGLNQPTACRVTSSTEAISGRAG
jgi:hypothetical protein